MQGVLGRRLRRHRGGGRDPERVSPPAMAGLEGEGDKEPGRIGGQQPARKQTPVLQPQGSGFWVASGVEWSKQLQEEPNSPTPGIWQQETQGRETAEPPVLLPTDTVTPPGLAVSHCICSNLLRQQLNTNTLLVPTEHTDLLLKPKSV